LGLKGIVMKRLGIVMSFALAIGMVAAVEPAHASFPGSNGRIAFASDRYGGTHNIFTMKPDGTDVRQLTLIASPDDGAALLPSWSPDGSRIVYDHRNADASVRQIFLMNADGSNQHVVFNETSYLDYDPSWSPDGSRLIFSRCRPDFEACAAYSVKTDGTGLTALTSLSQNYKLNIVDVDRPQYSPNGKAIAFQSYNRGGVTSAIYVADSRGSNIRRVTPTGLEAFDNDWSPSGNTLVFTTNCCTPQPAALWAINLDGSGLVQLTSANHDFAPSYSPQGDKIAFERDSADFSTSSILTISASGSRPHTIQTDAFQPSWGPAS
jgi:Tol biopolymer transport system component